MENPLSRGTLRRELQAGRPRGKIMRVQLGPVQSAGMGRPGLAVSGCSYTVSSLGMERARGPQPGLVCVSSVGV